MEPKRRTRILCVQDDSSKAAGELLSLHKNGLDQPETFEAESQVDLVNTRLIRKFINSRVNNFIYFKIWSLHRVSIDS